MEERRPRPRALPLVLLLALLAAPSAAAPSAAPERYDLSKYRGYACFMRDLMDWDAADLNLAYNSVPDHRYLIGEDLSFDGAKLEQAAAAGAALLKRRGDTLETLAGPGYARVLAPLPRFSDADFARINHLTRVVHFRYSREIARGLVCVAAHAFRQGRGEAAWRYLHAVLRFGAALRGGDGDPPTLIQGMIGNAIVNIGAGPFAWQALAESDLSPAQLRLFAAEIESTLAEMIPFRRIVESEYNFILNTIREHLFDASLWQNQSEDRLLGDVLAKIPSEARTKAVELTLKKVTEAYAKTFELLDTDETGVVASAARLGEIAEEIGRNGSPSLAMILSPMEAVGDLLLAIAYPNLGRAHVKDAEAMLRLRALASGARLLAALRERKGDDPPTAETARALCGTLPVDLHAAPREIRVASRDGALLLYSVGEDGKDDGGSPEADLILFLVRGVGARPTVSAALLAELSGDEAAAARTHRHALAESADPVAKETASRRLARLEGRPDPAAAPAEPSAGDSRGDAPPAEGRAAVTACLANLRVLEGATELWRMEHPGAEAVREPEPLVPRLVAEKYLKRAPACPDGGTYRLEDGAFRCDRHGGLLLRFALRLTDRAGALAGTAEAECAPSRDVRSAFLLPGGERVEIRLLPERFDAEPGVTHLAVEASGLVRAGGADHASTRRAALRLAPRGRAATPLPEAPFGGGTLEVELLVW